MVRYISKTLDGTASYDPDGDTPLGFAWMLVARPAGSTTMLASANMSIPSFTPDLPGDYVFELTVTDSLGALSVPHQIRINTENRIPVADAGDDAPITALGTVVSLNGCESYDPDGDALMYQWQITRKPSTSQATLSHPTACSTTFAADAHDAGGYVFTLTATDPFGAGNTDTVNASFVNVAPVAVAKVTNAGTIFPGNAVTLDGNGSSDRNLDPLTYDWSIVEKPSTSTADFAETEKVKVAPMFIADLPGTYVVSLVVRDGFVNSEPSPATAVVVTHATCATNKLSELTVSVRESTP